MQIHFRENEQNSIAVFVAFISHLKRRECSAYFFDKMGVDFVVCELTAVSGYIEENMLMDEMTTMLPLGDGQIQIAEVRIAEDAPVVDRKIGRSVFLWK